MAAVRLHRKPAWTDKLRAYKVLVDGTERAVIKEGETVTLDLSSGAHRVQLAIDWCRSPERQVDLTQGDVHLTCSAAASPFTALTHALFFRNKYITLEVGA